MYLGLHLATVANRDYTSDFPYPYEYAYYVFVACDVILEVGKVSIFTRRVNYKGGKFQQTDQRTCQVLVHPILSIKRPSTYLSLAAAAFVLVAMVLRFDALTVSDLETRVDLLQWSYQWLVWATPLMIFRVILWSGDLSWHVSKARYLVSQCIQDALWAVVLGAVTLVSFWIGLAALQREDVDALVLLRHLALGALQ